MRLRQPVVPRWDWEVRFNAREDIADKELVVVSVTFANRTARQDSAAGKSHLSIEHFVFDTAGHFAFEKCAVQPFSIELAPKGFRYNREVWARPFNCAVALTETNALSTTHIPTFIQKRYQTRSQPAALFSELALDPVPTLERILQAMEEYRSEWGVAEKVHESLIPAWRERHLEEFKEDRTKFDEEIKLFLAGLNLIRENPDIALAFPAHQRNILAQRPAHGKNLLAIVPNRFFCFSNSRIGRSCRRAWRPTRRSATRGCDIFSHWRRQD